jgi:hypothetical protein
MTNKEPKRITMNPTIGQFIILGLMFGVFSFGVGNIIANTIARIGRWYNQHEWQQMVYIVPPFVKKGTSVQLVDKKKVDQYIKEAVKEIKITPTPKQESKAVVKEVLANDDFFSKYKNPVTLRKIYQLESSSGKNDDCKAQSKFNGYGYRQNKNEHICFKTFEEVTGYVDEWIEDNKDMGLATFLCYYNTGYKTTNCEYYQKFINLK